MPNKNQFILTRLDSFESLINESADFLFNKVVKELLSQLDIKDGFIESSTMNLNKVQLIDKIYKSLDETKHLQIATVFANDIKDILQLGKEYYIDIFKRQATSQQIESIILKQVGINPDGTNRANSFITQVTDDPTIKQELKQLIFNQIASNNRGYEDLKNSIKEFLIGKGDEPGRYYKHYEQFAFDTYSEIDRLNSKLHANRLNLQYFLYNGGTVKDSRIFCKEHQGKAYTTKEAEGWKNEVNKFVMVPGKIKPFIKQVVGPIMEKELADQYDPILNMGGIRCRHSADFISEEVFYKLRLESDIEDVMKRRKSL